MGYKKARISEKKGCDILEPPMNRNEKEYIIGLKSDLSNRQKFGAEGGLL